MAEISADAGVSRSYFNARTCRAEASPKLQRYVTVPSRLAQKFLAVKKFSVNPESPSVPCLLVSARELSEIMKNFNEPDQQADQHLKRMLPC